MLLLNVGWPGCCSLMPWHLCVQMIAKAVQPEMLSTFSPQLLAMMCEGVARMEHRPSAEVLQLLVAQFEQLLESRPAHVRLMDCTTMLRAGLLWGILPDEVGNDLTESLLQVRCHWDCRLQISFVRSAHAGSCYASRDLPACHTTEHRSASAAGLLSDFSSVSISVRI